jgi:hypothetical protein
VDQDQVFLDQFRLPNRDGVLVLRRTVEETPQMAAELQATKQRLAAEAVASGADLSRPALRSLVVMQRDNGLMGIVDAAVAGR